MTPFRPNDHLADRPADMAAAATLAIGLVLTISPDRTERSVTRRSPAISPIASPRATARPASSRKRSRRCCSAGVYPPRCEYHMPRSYARKQPTSRPELYELILVSQVIVHKRASGGRCLLGAFVVPGTELGHIGRIEAATGLRRERFLSEFTTPVTAEDVAQAPSEHRARLQAAADSGQLLCGYINQASLTATGPGEDFAAAAPFVGALTGARAASITVALLTGGQVVPSGLRWQYDFLSNRARTAVIDCPDACECQTERAS